MKRVSTSIPGQESAAPGPDYKLSPLWWSEREQREYTIVDIYWRVWHNVDLYLYQNTVVTYEISPSGYHSFFSYQKILCYLFAKQLSWMHDDTVFSVFRVQLIYDFIGWNDRMTLIDCIEVYTWSYWIVELIEAEWHMYASVNLPSLVQIIVCVWSAPSRYLNQCWNTVDWDLIQTSLIYQSKFIHFDSRKCISKYRLENGGHFVSASMC